ncbi:Peptidase inhibitor 16, partial [Geodia barretti]
IAQSHYCAAIVKKMECLKIILFLGLAATASAAVCTNTIGVDGGRGQSWACLEIGSGCITSYVRYPGIATNPTITFCEGHNSDVSWVQLLATKLLILISEGPWSSGSAFAVAHQKFVLVDLRMNVDRLFNLLVHLKKYDLTLERFAQNYLDSLSTCLPQHNPNNSNYGENVYRQTTSKNFASDVNFEHMVQLWYDEVSYYNYWFNSCRLPEGLSCGHFTQVVWANTERVGCGVKICEDRNVTRTLVVCNYDPAGNIKPDRNSPTYRPYTSGLPCTRCPSTHPSCQNNFCVQSSGAQEVKQQLAEDVLKILLGLHGDKPQAGVEEWEMGSNGS